MPNEYTCSKRCHDGFVEQVISLFGDTKIITDATTGKRYRVPTREILENGIKHTDLPRFPLQPSE